MGINLEVVQHAEDVLRRGHHVVRPGRRVLHARRLSVAAQIHEDELPAREGLREALREREEVATAPEDAVDEHRGGRVRAGRALRAPAHQRTLDDLVPQRRLVRDGHGAGIRRGIGGHGAHRQARRAARARTPPERRPIRTGHAGPAPERPRDEAARRPGRAPSGRASRRRDATRGGGRRGRRRGVHRGRAAHPSARVEKCHPSNGRQHRRVAHQRSARVASHVSSHSRFANATHDFRVREDPAKKRNVVEKIDRPSRFKTRVPGFRMGEQSRNKIKWIVGQHPQGRGEVL